MIIVFFMDGNQDLAPRAEPFADNELVEALKFAEALRREGRRHVTISSEPDGAVGRPGAASVEDGRTPDGLEYEWSKAGRAGRITRAERRRWGNGT